MGLFSRKNPLHESTVRVAQLNAMTCLKVLRDRYPSTAGAWGVGDFVIVMSAASAFAAATSLSTVTKKSKFEKGFAKLSRDLGKLDHRGPALLTEVGNFAKKHGTLTDPKQAMECLGVWVVGMLLGRAPETDAEFGVAAIAGASVYQSFWRWFE